MNIAILKYLYDRYSSTGSFQIESFFNQWEAMLNVGPQVIIPYNSHKRPK